MPTTKVPEKALAADAVKVSDAEVASPEPTVVLLPKLDVNPLPLRVTPSPWVLGGLVMNIGHTACVPCRMRPKLMLRFTSGPVQGGPTVNVGAGTTVASRFTARVVEAEEESV